ncbi:hypothetical protein WH52_13035 [Tenacibaculum holothuriorum]|uniref:Uncharacterized protein n=1 Tax=Tenacibaculum holothuriorum TaxID=1635173 RepID=A0A1Y2PAY6_9FLAO|nr:hypothetical protein [Tenacibaculum holothuriorum]OSY87181.1 hypothetical protein WH52_13035 [Tenacibaculum holothuriorum]
MDSITRIYDNIIGISFRWTHTKTDLTQIIFRDTGFHLLEDEIEEFLEKIEDSKNQKKCATCSKGKDCKSILLQTPSNKVSMAVSLVELGQIEDLLKGTLFQLRMNNYLEDLCKN